KTPAVALTRLEQEIKADPNPDKICSYAELSYLEGVRLEESEQPQEALDYYGAAVAHAYWFLLDPNLDRFRNPYDPQFRRACDLYNGSLEGALRIAIKQGKVKPGQTQTLETASQKFRLDIEIKGPWHPEDLNQLEFVSDYEVAGG